MNSVVVMTFTVCIILWIIIATTHYARTVDWRNKQKAKGVTAQMDLAEAFIMLPLLIIGVIIGIIIRIKRSLV